MSKTWFAGNFCPHDAECSLEEGALSPTNGPKIRTLKLLEPKENPFLATVMQFTTERSFYEADYNPQDWAKCNGALIPITQNVNLFSVLGTMYGGDGRTTFGLPNIESNHEGDYYIYLLSDLR